MSILHKITYISLLVFIFSMPWGNGVWDGLTKYIGLLAFALAALYFLMEGAEVKLGLYHFFMVVFVVWATLSLLWSPATLWSSGIVGGQPRLTTILQLMLIPLIISLLINSKEKLLAVYQSYVLGNLTGTFFILYNYLNGIESKYYQRYGISDAIEIDGLSIVLALSIPMAAYLTTQVENKWMKVLYGLSIPTIYYGIFLTGTRTASIVALFGVIYWLFSIRKSTVLVKSSILMMFVVSIALVVYAAPDASLERILSAGESLSGGTLNSRTTIWEASLSRWEDSPLIGHGLGSIVSVLNMHHISFVSAHNTYIHILLELGIIGLLVFLLILITILVYILQVKINEKVFLLALFLTIATSMLTMNMLYEKETWLVFSLLMVNAFLFLNRAPAS